MTAGFDYVIVGAGAAGCVVAARLAEDPGIRIAVIEAGGQDSAVQIRIPGANVATGSDPRFNWSYQTDPVPELGDRKLYWAQGRILGGSGSINGMMYLRGHPADYDQWAAMGCAGWGHRDLLPYFRKSETNERGASDLHGGDGPMQVCAGQATAPICDIFLEAAASVGFTVTDDLNKDMAQGFGHVDMTIGGGRRSSTSAAFLHPAVARGNVTVQTTALVTRVVIEGGVARGVDYVQKGQTRRLMADRAVVLCGGAVNSPQLLMLSGIGPANQLRALGLPVHADRPEVGQNLQNHPMYKLMFATTAPVTAYSHAQPLGAAKAGLQYLLGRRGVLARGLFPTAGFLQADPGDASTEVQVCMAPAPMIRHKPGVLGILPREHGFTLLLNIGSPHSRGVVQLASADPTAPARIRPDFFSDPRDIGILARGARRTLDIVHSGPLAPILGRQLDARGPIGTEAQIAADIRASAGTHYHACGTCRMGADDGAVVDPQLRVRGVDRLFVADASIMPVLVNGNTYAASVMIGEKAADLIRAA